MRRINVALMCCAASLAAAPAGPPSLTRFEVTQRVMGVPVRILLYAPGEEAAKSAAQAAFERMQRLNDILSDYDQESELSRLSAAAGSGTAVAVSDDLWRVLAKAREISVASEGAFDITIGPVVRHWRLARYRRRH